jgi:CheY-like chemotaxis protein
MRHEHSVLVVDDDIQTRSALSSLLRESGFKTSRARNGAEALRRLRSRKKPCAVLLDLMMPGMTGWELMEMHRESAALSSVPLLLVTGWVDTDVAQAKALIAKPVEPRKLLRKLRALLAQERRRVGKKRPRGARKTSDRPGRN